MDVLKVIQTASAAIQAAVVAATAIWAYRRFHQEGRHEQSIDLYIDCSFMGPEQDWYVAAFTIHATNRGNIEYRFEDIRLRVLGIKTNDHDPLKAWIGREPLLEFPEEEFETVNIIPLKKEYYGYKPLLMPPLNDVSDIPTEGKNLIIVAAVNNVLHFRIFDGDGKMAVDTDEKRLTEQARQLKDLRKQLKRLWRLWPPYAKTRKKRLTEQARQLKDLRKQLERLWPPYEMTKSDEGRVVRAVTSIVGHTRYYFVRPGVHQRFSFVTRVPASWKYVLANAKFMYETHELHTTERAFEVKPDIKKRSK